MEYLKPTELWAGRARERLRARAAGQLSLPLSEQDRVVYERMISKAVTQQAELEHERGPGWMVREVERLTQERKGERKDETD